MVPTGCPEPRWPGGGWGCSLHVKDSRPSVCYNVGIQETIVRADHVVDPHRSSTTSWPSSSSGAESPMKVTLSAAPGFARFSWLVVIRSGLALAHASAATAIAIAGCGLLLHDGLALRRLWGASSRAP